MTVFPTQLEVVNLSILEDDLKRADNVSKNGSRLRRLRESAKNAPLLDSFIRDISVDSQCRCYSSNAESFAVCLKSLDD